MDWFKKNKLRSQLPEAAIVNEASFNGWSKVEIYLDQQILSRQIARDLRMARLLALAQAIGRWHSIEVGGFWFYRPTENQARTQAVLDAVKKWAWLQWVANDYAVPSLLDRTRWSADLTKVLGASDSKGRAFQKPISFFEAELGILHLQFSVFAGAIESHWYVGSFCTFESEDPWGEVLSRWSWQHAIDTDAVYKVSDEIKDKIRKARDSDLSEALARCGTKIEWPALRMAKVIVKPLGENLGYLAQAEADMTLVENSDDHRLLLSGE